MSEKVALISGFGMDSKTLTHFLLKRGYHVFVATRRNTIIELDSIKDFFTQDLKENPEAKLSTLFPLSPKLNGASHNLSLFISLQPSTLSSN